LKGRVGLVLEPLELIYNELLLLFSYCYGGYVLKIIFVTGSLSGLGKGTIAASIASILQAYGFDITMAKIDPYLNIDAGLFNPHEHGEVFVLDEIWEFEPVSGYKYRICEVDQDLGIYERFIHRNLHPSHNITSGQIYLSVILRERKGEYLGKTVQLIPHVTSEIKNRILRIAEKYDITIVEVGGTVGDYEAAIFLEAIRQLRNELPHDDTFLIHVVWVPYLKVLGEFKTKPAQQSFRFLLESGLSIDTIVARIEKGSLTRDTINKLALYSNISSDCIFEVPNLETPYETLMVLYRQGIHNIILNKLGLTPCSDPTTVLDRWNDFILKIKNSKQSVKICLVGKYTRMMDTYFSIIDALKHTGASLNIKPEIDLIDSEKIILDVLAQYDGIILTPGFGVRGTEGMINTAVYSLRTHTPLLGICFGAQLGAVAFAREYMNWDEANSTEIDPNTKYPVVDLLPEQHDLEYLGGTMRLGGINIIIKPNTMLHRIYGSDRIKERFRHRYHIIPEYAEKMQDKGFIINALDKKGRIAAYEIQNHPFFIGVQYHPEYTSRPLSPHPLFIAFLKECIKRKKSSLSYARRSQ